MGRRLRSSLRHRPAPLDRPLRPAGGGGAMTAPRVKLDIDATREKLAALGCGSRRRGSGAAAGGGCPRRDSRPSVSRAPARCRAVRPRGAAHPTMLKSSKIPTGQTLENFDFAFQPAIERSRIETLATGAWIRNAEVILLQGPPGVGKSHFSWDLASGRSSWASRSSTSGSTSCSPRSRSMHISARAAEGAEVHVQRRCSWSTRWATIR